MSFVSIASVCRRAWGHRVKCSVSEINLSLALIFPQSWKWSPTALGWEVTLTGWEQALCKTKMGSQGLCILHFSRPNWGVHASLRGNDLPSSFSKTVILHLDTLLESFNYHYFALSLQSCCDPLFRVFGFSAFYLPSGGRSWDFLCNLGSVTLGTRTPEWNQRSLGGGLEDRLVSVLPESWLILLVLYGVPFPTNTLGSSLLWDLGFSACCTHSQGFCQTNFFKRCLLEAWAPHPNLN